MDPNNPIQGVPFATPVKAEPVAIGVNAALLEIENNPEILEDDVIAMQRIIRKIISKGIKIKGNNKLKDGLVDKLQADLSALSDELAESLLVFDGCANHAQVASVTSPQSFKFRANKETYTTDAIEGIIVTLNEYHSQHNLPPCTSKSEDSHGTHVSVAARQYFTSLIDG
mmetsp:Transcript_1843/g.2555  ORF Transcript_1843/g.2555 Transcript_1843/m.2555 type:complete len:170 (+) Transcript_1843:120-629(+)|eukprot:CAMPEP_0170061452 /NCGR_PEP_ID=MMETSP0019_2-20121128/3008_1 /TAXON_ID=98059 /ORGANISM="Dinobryon sp., Strain UTEXLB2267" /LENGTH=169 /DNA_ID=CAMNT_0010267273 /DNA_START=120 /DNA_END=629 /DNA_ORIENTATION=+